MLNWIGKITFVDFTYPHCLPSYSEQPWCLRSVPAIIIIPITKSVINISVAYSIDKSFTVIWWNYIRIIQLTERNRICYNTVITRIGIFSPLFIRHRGRYKVCRKNSCSNNQKLLLLLSNLRDDNDRHFQWCCYEHYLQRHNTLWKRWGK